MFKQVCVRVRSSSDTLSNEDLQVFERGPSCLQTRTFTCSNEDPHAFELGPSHVPTRTFTRSNEDPDVFKRGPSLLRTRPGHVRFACGSRLHYTLCLTDTALLLSSYSGPRGGTNPPAPLPPSWISQCILLFSKICDYSYVLKDH